MNKKINPKSSALSRRDVLRLGGAGLVAAGAGYAFSEEKPAAPQTQTPSASSPPDPCKSHVVIPADSLSLTRDRELCDRCGHCLEYCYRYSTVQGHRGAEGRLACIDCGQCSIRCCSRAITERSGIAKMKAALADPDTVVVASTSPAVRVALGEMFAMPAGSFVEGKMAASLKKLGCDYVLDTTFGADLTIMEEASELLRRLERNADAKYPLFTSCCPAWVRFAEMFAPQLVPHISTTKSPIMMQGAAIKTWFAVKKKLRPKRIFTVAVTPCTAKKAEIRRQNMNTLADYPGTEGLREIDLVLTARELGTLLKEHGIDFARLPQAGFDSFMGRGSGAGVAFGRSGGVMESALRTAYFLANGENAPLEKTARIRGELHTVNWVDPRMVTRIAGVREDIVDFGGRELSIAVVETLGSLRGLLDLIESGDKRFDFVEVMACQGGCLGGGGQPYPPSAGELPGIVDHRRNAMREGVDRSTVRLCHENREVALAYREFFGTPLSEKAEKLLHCVK